MSNLPITIRHQKRKSLAMQLTPTGPVVLVPHHLDAASAPVQHFIAAALAKLPPPPPASAPLSRTQIHQLVTDWSTRLNVTVTRTQIRTMRNKWGSISTAGILTLTDDIVALPLPLAEYIIVHELLHLHFANHSKVWQTILTLHLPDWRARHQQLSAYTALPPNASSP